MCVCSAGTGKASRMSTVYGAEQKVQLLALIKVIRLDPSHRRLKKGRLGGTANTHTRTHARTHAHRERERERERTTP